MVQDSARLAQSMASARPDRVGLGIITIVAAVLAMSFQDAVVKYVSAGMPLWQIYVLRSLLALPILLVLLRFKRRPTAIRPISPGWAFLRSLQGNRISDLGEQVGKECVAPSGSFDFASV